MSLATTTSIPFSAAAARRRAFRAAVWRVCQGLWAGMERAGERKAARELARFVEMHGKQYPELAARYARRTEEHPAD